MLPPGGQQIGDLVGKKGVVSVLRDLGLKDLVPGQDRARSRARSTRTSKTTCMSASRCRRRWAARCCSTSRAACSVAAGVLVQAMPGAEPDVGRHRARNAARRPALRPLRPRASARRARSATRFWGPGPGDRGRRAAASLPVPLHARADREPPGHAGNQGARRDDRREQAGRGRLQLLQHEISRREAGARADPRRRRQAARARTRWSCCKSADEVATALAEKRPVVALESTHRRARPAVAREPRRRPRARGRRCATHGARARDDRGRRAAASSSASTRRRWRRWRARNGAERSRKAGAADLAAAPRARRERRDDGVSATAFAAARAGIRVFATGGIGGVHRGDERRRLHDLDDARRASRSRSSPPARRRSSICRARSRCSRRSACS